MKILVDMNLSPRWVRFLSDAGIEAEHWSDLGAGDASDIEIMAFARAHGHVVFTHDSISARSSQRRTATSPA